MPEQKYSFTERKEFVAALAGTKMGQDWLKSPERKALRPGRGLAANWTEAYPLFNLEVSGASYKLTNNTGFDHDKGNMEKQVKWLNQFGANNVEEGGAAVKRVAVVVCSDGDELSNDTFTNGWKPFQDKTNKKANNKLAYFIEYTDGTNSGWLRWSAYVGADSAVWDADSPLGGLAGGSVSRGFARAAREQVSKSR